MDFKVSPLWERVQAACGQYGHWGDLYDAGGTPTPIALIDTRWASLAASDWTDRDTAIVEYAYHLFVEHVWPHKNSIYLLYGACLEFARANPDYQVWLGGELLI
jgi:hypothetical protein